MTERYVENVFNDVNTLVSVFSQYFPDEGTPLLESLHDVYDIPEIGEAIFDEEVNDITTIIAVLKTKTELSEPEAAMLAEAESLLSEIDCKVTYLSGVDRNNAVHTIAYNFDRLRELSEDIGYQHSLEFALDKVKELFKNRLGTRPGTIIFHNALDVLASFYYYALILDDLNKDDKNNIPELIIDIATNINDKAKEYLENKDPVFKLHKN